MKAVLENQKPNSDVKKTKTDNGEAHDRAGGESNLQSGVEAFACCLSGTRVSGGCYLHADKACQAGINTAGDKGKRNKYGNHSEPCQNSEDNYHCQEEQSNGFVLTLKISVCAAADCRGDFLHGLVALRKLQDLAALNQGKQQCEQSAYQTYPEIILQSRVRAICRHARFAESLSPCPLHLAILYY